MKFVKSKVFEKQVSKILDKFLLELITATIQNIIDAENHTEITNIKKLKGHTNAYRIRIGTHRIGIIVDNNVVYLSDVAHRKDIYKQFP